MAQPAYHDQGARLRNLATEPGVLVFYRLPHAERRMRKRGISKPDVKSTLMAGAVVNVEWDVFEERWTVQGHDKDGRLIRVVVVVNEEKCEIDVVTVLD